MTFPLNFRLAVVLKRARSSAVLTSLAGKTQRNQISQDVEGGFLGLASVLRHQSSCKASRAPRWKESSARHGVIPRHRRRNRQGKVGSPGGPGLASCSQTTPFPPLLPQSLRLKFHRQGRSEGRQEQTCFREGGLNFLPEWAFSQGELRKCCPTATSSSSVRKSHR